MFFTIMLVLLINVEDFLKMQLKLQNLKSTHQKFLLNTIFPPDYASTGQLIKLISN